jgi:hypothetical protein
LQASAGMKGICKAVIHARKKKLATFSRQLRQQEKKCTNPLNYNTMQQFIIKTDRTQFVTTGSDRMEVINQVERQLSLQNYLFKTKETLRDVSLAIRENAKLLNR